MASATVERHPGRRSPASEKEQERHEGKVRKAVAARDAIQKKYQESLDALGSVINDAMQAGVQTQEIGNWFSTDEKPDGVTRQMVYKIVRERFDDKQPSSNGRASKSKSATKAKPKGKTAAKPKATPKAKPAKTAPKAKPAAKKTASKPKAKAEPKRVSASKARPKRRNPLAK